MTQSTDRLDRIESLLATVAESQARTEANLSRTEQLVAQNAAGLRETRAITESNARAIEAWGDRIDEGIIEAEEVSSSMVASSSMRLEEAIATTVQLVANMGQQQQETDQRFNNLLEEARADRQRADRDRALNESEHRAFRETFQTMLAEIARLWQRVAG